MPECIENSRLASWDQRKFSSHQSAGRIDFNSGLYFPSNSYKLRVISILCSQKYGVGERTRVRYTLRLGYIDPMSSLIEYLYRPPSLLHAQISDQQINLIVVIRAETWRPPRAINYPLPPLPLPLPTPPLAPPLPPLSPRPWSGPPPLGPPPAPPLPRLFDWFNCWSLTRSMISSGTRRYLIYRWGQSMYG